MIKPGIQVATQSRTLVLVDDLTMRLLKAATSTTTKMRRTLKSTVWTETWPTHALARQVLLAADWVVW